MMVFTRRLRPLLVLCLLCACDEIAVRKVEIDAAWHRQQLIAGHLARWLAVAPTESGLFRTAMTRAWTAKAATSGDLTHHSRLIYAMAAGYELTQDRHYLDAAVGGARFLLERFRDPVHGGYFDRVTADGKVVSDAKGAYGHAFALFALSHLYRVTKDDQYRAAAMNTWREINANLRDAHGGFLPEASRAFVPRAGGRSQNPLMHLFEALLALGEATRDAQVLAAADSVGKFVTHQLLQGLPDGSAYIPEWYDEQWRALTDKAKGGHIDIGHQFEWVHLLLAAENLGLSAVYGATAARILQYALAVGYDESDGGAFNRVYPDGSVDRDKFWWRQAECLRALIAAAGATGRRDLWRRYEQTLALINKEFIDPAGGWRLATAQRCERVRCEDTQPDPYHMTGMHLAAIKAAAAAK